MPYTNRDLANFSLRGLSVEELRDLSREFLEEDESTISTTDKADLISLLSEAAASNRGLSNTLRKKSISIKPSFYLTRISSGERVALKSAKANMKRHLMRSDKGLRNLQCQLVDEYEPDVIQILLTWESELTYWTPSIQLERVKQLEFGFAILDFRARKAIIACHTVRERDEISDLLCAGFSVEFTGIVLTKPLLEQIGTFDKVKRASYVIASPDAVTPANIVYADDNLGVRRLAFEEENNSRSQRNQSFYRIPILDGLLEEGLGATSETGKLWIPKETPIELVREYGTALLGKISGTIQKMAQNDQIEGVLSTYRFEEMPDLSSADPMKLREALAELIRTVIVMLGNREEERAYSVPAEIAVHGAPHFFCYPFLRLVDDETGAVALWTDPLYHSHSVRVTGQPGDLEVKSEPGKTAIDLQRIVHPITDRTLQISDVLTSLHLVPSEHLLRITWDIVNRISTRVPKLRDVKAILFWISGNTLKVDLRRAYGTAPPPTLLRPYEFSGCETLFQNHTVRASDRKAVNERLFQLGEKCTSMSDDNCRTCLQDKKFICLRSLVGRYFKDTKILAHKGIEVSDLSARGMVNGNEKRIWGFAKLPSGKSEKGLTLRNGPGAVLMAQVCGQLDRTTFDTVLILTPATVNQDFQERLEVFCNVFQKQLCFLDLDDLGRMLLAFEAEAEFEGIEVKKIYDASRKRKRQKTTSRKTTSS